MGDVDNRLLEIWTMLRAKQAEERQSYEPVAALLRDITYLRLCPEDGVVVQFPAISDDR